MRTADPQISFADLEFVSQGIHLDPVLEQILEFVTRNAALVETVRRQLDDGLKEPQTGRRGLTAEQTILSLILMRVKNWDYRELAERIADGIRYGNSPGSTAILCPSTTLSTALTTD
jgi:IS5 family transposase